MANNTVILVRQNGLGCVDGDDSEFGEEMFDQFIHSLEGLPQKPQALCFYTRGVRLACEGSKAILGLRILQGMGVQLLLCTTCLNHYGLADKVAAGTPSTMAGISRLLMEADRVITV